MCARLVSLFLLLCAASRALAVEAVPGEYDSPLGRVKLTGDGVSYEGRLLRPRDGVPYAVGAPVLRATLLDDSLAGEVRVPVKETRSCQRREVWASAVLLVGTSGLSGAVHLPKGCRGPVGKKGGFRFSRAIASVAEPVDPPDHAREEPRLRPSKEKGVTSPARGRAQALMRDGGAYLNEGDFEKARKRFLSAISEDAAIPEAYNGVGVSYRMRDDLPRALDWYKRALAVDPDFGDAYYNMACVYAVRGEKQLALRYLQIAALNGYTTAEIMDHDSDLESLRSEEAYKALLGQRGK